MRRLRAFIPAAIMAAVLTAIIAVAVHGSSHDGFSSAADDEQAIAAAQPALSVEVTTPRTSVLPNSLPANGNIMAWQEAIIGNETDGLRLATVEVNVGDVVQRGQVLAIFASNMVNAGLARSSAAVAEAEAALVEAKENAQRARKLQATGAMTAQQIQQYMTAERIAQARLEAMQADEKTQQLRVAQTQVLAPDDGVVSSRSATVGAVLPAGQELFRLIRDGRLEWRAEVAASDLAKLQPGQIAKVTLPGGGELDGRVRTIAPLVDVSTRNGTVYVDLPANDLARAGMFARGEFELGTRQALTLPRSAVQLRDGFGYVHHVSEDCLVTESKVALGQYAGDRIEIISGLDPDARVVASGGAFLGNGDRVEVLGEADDGVADGAIGNTERLVTSLSGRQP